MKDNITVQEYTHWAHSVPPVQLYSQRLLLEVELLLGPDELERQ